MISNSQSFEGQLNSARIVIVNSLADSEILGLVSAYGYNSAKLNEGKVLYENTHKLYQQQKNNCSLQVTATLELKNKLAEANRKYAEHIKMARIVFQSDWDTFLKLGLRGKRERTRAGWMKEAKQFYINAISDSDAIAKFSAYGITESELEVGKQLVHEVELLSAAQEEAKGKAQRATKDRNASLKKLEKWVSNFIVFARIATKEKPQLLEKLGLKVKS